MYQVQQSSRFAKELKKIKKQGKDIAKLQTVVVMLAQRKKLPLKCKNHPLKGNWAGYFDCHIEPDWLLIYKIDHAEEIIKLAATGSHADLFDM